MTIRSEEGIESNVGGLAGNAISQMRRTRPRRLEYRPLAPSCRSRCPLHGGLEGRADVPRTSRNDDP